MTVFQDKRRPGKPWVYSFFLRKQRYQGDCVDAQGVPAATKRAALDVQADRRQAARQAQSLAKSGLRRDAYTLNQAAILYLARKQTDAPSDYDNQLSYIREIRAFRDPDGHDYAGGHKAFVDVTDEDNQAYRRHLTTRTIQIWTGGPKRKRDAPNAARFWKDSGRKLAPRQVNKHLVALKALFTIATKTRDPVTREFVLDAEPEIKLLPVPKRIPRPIGDEELAARQAEAPQWTREAAELSRLFGLRQGEAFWVGLQHVDRTTNNELVGLRFRPNETKSGNEELAFGGEAGSELLLELEAQARARGTRTLVAWPGKKYFRAFMLGRDVPRECWVPLKSVRSSWKRAAERAGVENPHRFHDVRARFITEVAKVQPSAAQDAARHQDPATTALYIKLASSEVRDAVSQAMAQRPAPRKLKIVK
jgi:hypothetical protein